MAHGIRQLLVALFSARAAAVTVEVYYGPYCPNSANYLSMYLQPLLEANIPGLMLTVMPYAIDPNLHAMPAGCPGGPPGTPCNVLPAPLCALEQFVPQMPAPITPPYKAAVEFAVCDLIHANHGAPAMLTHTPADIQQCAMDNQANWGQISACMANPGAAPQYQTYVAKITAADQKLPPGKVAPFIFIDGVFTENTIPLPQAVCAKTGPSPACAAMGAFDMGVPQIAKAASLPVPMPFLLAAAAAVGATVIFVTYRAVQKKKSPAREEGLKGLVAEAPAPADEETPVE